MRVISFFLSFVLLASACGTPTTVNPVIATTEVVPISIDFGGYPVQPGPLSMKEMARLGLRPKVLTKRWVGLNYFARIRRVALDTLQVGEIVLVDSLDIPRYKQDCGNLLGQLPVCTRCIFTTAPSDTLDRPVSPPNSVTSNRVTGAGTPKVVPATTDVQSAQRSETRASEPGFWDGVVGKGLKAIGTGFLWLLAILIGLALLIAVARMLFRGLAGSQTAPVVFGNGPTQTNRREQNLYPAGFGWRRGETDRRREGIDNRRARDRRGSGVDQRARSRRNTD